MGAIRPEQPADPMKHDEMIMRAVKARPEEGLAVLLSVHGPRIRSALRRCFPGRPDLVDPAVSAALTRLWREPQAYDPARGSLARYLIMLASYEIRTVLRREAAGPLLVPPAAIDVARPAAGGPPPDPAADRDERPEVHALHQLIQRLARRERQVLLADLRRGHEVPADELARELGTTPGAVWKARSAGRRKLVGLLEASGEEQRQGRRDR